MAYEPILRMSVFLGVFAIMAAWEWRRPFRMRQIGRVRRWSTNWAIVILDSAVVRLLFPAAAVGAALDAAASGWGLFNALEAPLWLSLPLSLLVLDFAIWAQHLVFHKIPVLWRLHKVHHADRDVDVTTAIRFHPVEIALSMALKIGLVYALGAPAAAVLAFEVLLNACAMFNHSNIRLAPRVERALRAVIMTPDLHRIHHSVLRAEHDSNYGFNLSIWDRVFGTWTEAPRAGQEGMTIGLAPHQDEAPGRLLWSLALPFRGRA